MRKIIYGLLIIIVLSACSQEENTNKENTEAEVLTKKIKNVEIPTTIFTFEKSNRDIDEKEMKQSIKIYLDSDAALDNARSPFNESIWEDQKLTKEEMEKYNSINKLLTENDENFSRYISNNSLPKGYQKESERISRYITGFNKEVQESNEADIAGEDDLSEIDNIIDNYSFVNGKEQKKIEAFLDKKHIETKAFNRDKKK